jgi:hypothetical protein|tara:strand:+ start:1090 stop:1323 length:234 start_codon:yes stop_codon:yes gene_type:complete
MRFNLKNRFWYALGRRSFRVRQWYNQRYGVWLWGIIQAVKDAGDPRAKFKQGPVGEFKGPSKKELEEMMKKIFEVKE